MSSAAPSLATAARLADAVMQRRTAAYLLLGTRVRMTMEQVPDVLDGEPVYLSSGLCTDGEWFWRLDLAHYVMKYNVALDPAFYEHASGHAWSPGVLNGDDLARAVQHVRQHDG